MQRKKETCLSLKDEKTFLKIIREEQKQFISLFCLLSKHGPLLFRKEKKNHQV